MRYICAATIASFLLMAVANGTWCCWWFGGTFGNRAFLDFLPALSLVAALSLSPFDTGSKTPIAMEAAMLAVAAAIFISGWDNYYRDIHATAATPSDSPTCGCHHAARAA